jgi:hypothetical protein
MLSGTVRVYTTVRIEINRETERVDKRDDRSQTADYLNKVDSVSRILS